MTIKVDLGNTVLASKPEQDARAEKIANALFCLFGLGLVTAAGTVVFAIVGTIVHFILKAW